MNQSEKDSIFSDETILGVLFEPIWRTLLILLTGGVGLYVGSVDILTVLLPAVVYQGLAYVWTDLNPNSRRLLLYVLLPLSLGYVYLVRVDTVGGFVIICSMLIIERGVERYADGTSKNRNEVTIRLGNPSDINSEAVDPETCPDCGCDFGLVLVGQYCPECGRELDD